MTTMLKKSMMHPDESRDFPKGKLDLVSVDSIKFGLATFNPGWKWSESLMSIAKTESCQASHTNYHISGKLHVKMDDGTEFEYGPGDIGVIPPGHDAWTIGDEPAVLLDISGMVNYAK